MRLLDFECGTCILCGSHRRTTESEGFSSPPTFSGLLGLVGQTSGAELTCILVLAGTRDFSERGGARLFITPLIM